jgi:toluene monooxygenase system protein E
MNTSASAPTTLRTRKVKTWSSLGKLGRKPNEYEIVTHGMNHTVGATPLEMGAEVHGNRWLLKHRDGAALKPTSLDEFRDPDQLTYRKYTQLMDEQETYLDGVLQHYSDVHKTDRQLKPQVLDLLAHVLTPTRYLGHGLQMVSAYVQQMAHSSYVANCASFQTADQLRRVQRIAYRTRQLNDMFTDRGFGSGERAIWERDADWQPTREAIERLLVAYDWDQAFVGLNMVVKPVVDELFLKAFATVARDQGDELDAVIAENLYLDAQRSQRWTVHACRSIVGRDAVNLDILDSHVAHWRPHGQAIIESASRLLARHAPGTRSQAIADRAWSAWAGFLAEAGIGSAT